MSNLEKLLPGDFQVSVLQIAEQVEGHSHRAVCRVFDGHNAMCHRTPQHSIKDILYRHLRHKRGVYCVGKVDGDFVRE